MTVVRRCNLNAIIMRLRDKMCLQQNEPANARDKMIAAIDEELEALRKASLDCHFKNIWLRPEEMTTRQFCNKLVDELLHDHDHFIRVLEAARDALDHTEIVRSSIDIAPQQSSFL